MGSHFRLRGRISILVAGGAVVVAVGLALLLANAVRVRNAADASIRSSNYLVGVINLERLVVDAETGLRGYIITRNPLFLAPLRSAQARLPQAIADVRKMAARDQSFRNDAQGLITASQAYFSNYVAKLLAIAAQDPRRARSLETTLIGKYLVDGIRARAATLVQRVSARGNARQRAARSSASDAVTESVVLLAVLTVLTFLVGTVLGRMAVGRDRARRRAEDTNRTLQESLLPPALPEIQGCELAVRFSPAGAGDLVGGDFYDVFAVGPASWAIIVGDVCGKGAEAAAVTAMARWTLRSRAASAVAPAHALEFLNDEMLRQDLGARFITLAYLLVRIESDQASVSVACAGHPAPILVPSAGEPRRVGAQGTLLGVWREIELEVSEIELERGDALVAYTDGVTDQGPVSDAAQPLKLLGSRSPDATAEQLATALDSHAHRLDGPQRDDIAILVLRFVGTGRDGLRPAASLVPAEQAVHGA